MRGVGSEPRPARAGARVCTAVGGGAVGRFEGERCPKRLPSLAGLAFFTRVPYSSMAVGGDARGVRGREDQPRFQKALRRFQREDPTFRVEVKQDRPRTRERLMMWGWSSAFLEMAQSRRRKRLGGFPHGRICVLAPRDGAQTDFRRWNFFRGSCTCLLRIGLF